VARRAPKRVWIPLAGALVLVICSLVAFLSTDASTLAYENGKQVQVGAVVPPGGLLCQGGQYVPKHASRLRVWISTAHRRGGPVSVLVREGGAVLARGGAPGGYRDQPVSIPISRVQRDAVDADVCVRDAGATGIALMGEPAAANELQQVRAADPLDQTQAAAVVTPRTPQPNGHVVVRFEWHQPPIGSWWALAPTVARRLSFAKASFVGSGTLWLIGALVVAMGAAAAWALTREGAR